MKKKETLLVFNCHEPWVYQLGILGYNLDIIIGLKGRHTERWDEQMRPLPRGPQTQKTVFGEPPPRSRLITLSEALQSTTCYYCIITHNITDLLDIKSRPEPRLILLHATLEGRIEEENSNVPAGKMKQILQKYLKLVGGHVVATSMFKGESWGFTEDIVTSGVDPNDYLPYSGQIACGLRICNFIESRKKILLWDFHEKAFSDIPVRLVGHNPNMPGVTASKNWDHLKQILQSHRFYIHTADPRFEAGHNMATAEAMAAGLPVLGNRHPTSLIKHGVSGFLSDDPDELRKYARMLLQNRNLAVSMGKLAQKTAIEHLSMSKFKQAFTQSIETARRKWQSRTVN